MKREYLCTECDAALTTSRHMTSGCPVCGAIMVRCATLIHPASWLDCPDCRARSKSGAEPPRCAVWIANEAKLGKL